MIVPRSQFCVEGKNELEYDEAERLITFYKGKILEKLIHKNSCKRWCIIVKCPNMIHAEIMKYMLAQYQTLKISPCLIPSKRLLYH